MADINSNLPTIDITDGTPGSAAPTLAEQVAGSDGTNLRVLSTDSTGKLNINNVAGTVSLPTGASTSANQTNGTHKTQIVDSANRTIASALYNGTASLQTSFADGAQIDGVGALRVSDRSVLANYCFYQGLQPLSFNTALTGSGTLTFVAAAASASLNVTTTNGDSVIYQTKQYLPYTPGLSHVANLSLNVGAAKTNVIQRWGMYDANDGLGFVQTSAGISIFTRTSTSGSIVDTVVPQASWNLDPLNGTGLSGITLNTAFHNKYVIEYSWHGAGRVRWGVFLNGQTVYVHQINYGNVSAFPYTRTPKLPLRVELVNTGTAASATSILVVCMSLFQEASSSQIQKYNFSRSNRLNLRSVTSLGLPILSIQPLANYNGIVNRVSIIPQTIQLFSNTQNLLVQIVLNGALTGASFSAVDTNSATQYDVSALTMTGGTIIGEFYVTGGTTEKFDLSEFANSAILSNTITGTAGDILTIYASSFGAGSNSVANIQWEEV